MKNRTPSFDAYYVTFEISLWIASTFGVEKLRKYVNQAKKDVAYHDALLMSARHKITRLAKNTRTYRIESNPATKDVVSLSVIFGSDESLETFQISDDSPEENVLVRQYQKLLQDFLIYGKLKPREREVFIRQAGLLGVKQYFSKDIALNLGISRQNVEVSAKSALAKCKAFLIKRGFSVEDLR